MVMGTVMDTAMVKKPAANSLCLRPLAVMAALACAAPWGWAQDAPLSTEPKESLTFETRLSINQTWTDNVRLTPVGEAERITEVSPGFRLVLNKARLKGFFDYTLNGLAYAGGTSPNRSLNALSTNMALEAIDNTFFIEASGTISQQAVSAFGLQSIDNTNLNANRVEVATYRLSPYLQGRLGGFANYLVRVGRTVTASDSKSFAGNEATNASVALKGDLGPKGLGWTVDVGRQTVSYSAGRTTENDRQLVGLTFALSPQFSLSAEGGTESSNFASLDKEAYAVSGLGLTWTPMESTNLTVNARRQSYGDTHQLNFNHRTGRTVWQFSDGKDLTQAPNLQGSASLGSVYDLYFAQFAYLQPDPVARAQLVNAYLQNYGMAPDIATGTGFSASSLSLQRRQQLSFALLGVRDTITFLASQSKSSRLDTLSTAIDDFTTASDVQQQSLSVNFAHRLTPHSSLGLMLSRAQTTGVTQAQTTKLSSANLSWTSRVGKRSSTTAAVRRVVSETLLRPYSETAATVSLNLQF